MKISSIKIVNFRGIKNTTLVPEHLNVFMGQNGSGKTSILNAITFALTGDMKSEYIQTGAKSAVVEITFADGSSIERKKVKSGNTSCKVNGNLQPVKAQMSLLKASSVSVQRLTVQWSALIILQLCHRKTFQHSFCHFFQSK